MYKARHNKLQLFTKYLPLAVFCDLNSELVSHSLIVYADINVSHNPEKKQHRCKPSLKTLKANIIFFIIIKHLTLILPWKVLSAKCLVWVNFQSASKSFKVCETEVRVSNSLDPDEMLSWRLIRIQAVCMWDYGRDRQDKG